MASNTKNRNIIYIARDIERALGRVPENNYYIVTNRTPYSAEIHELYPNNILLINSEEILNTHGLLSLKEVQEMITKLDADILVFKNNSQIENLCKEKNWTLLNPNADLSEKIENKISQIKWLDELASLLPPHKILETKNIAWNKEAFILQWSHGHTGDGTILIQNENDLNKLKEKFPNREAKVTDFIKGPMFTMNIVVTKTAILLGNISYQITGMLPFTNNPFSTIGNDWSVPHTILTEEQIIKVEKIAEKIAQKTQKDGWKGLFGIDVILDEERDMIHLIEINARQPASTTFESELQAVIRSHGLKGLTIFEAHLLALTDSPISIDDTTVKLTDAPLLLKSSDIINNKHNTLSPILVNDGAQIIQRVMLENSSIAIDSNKLTVAGYKVIKYANTKPNEDLVRIQSSLGIMETHNKFNGRGKKVVELLLD